MLANAAKNPYSDRQLVEIAMNITRNTNISRKDKPTGMEKYQDKTLGNNLRHTLKKLQYNSKKSEGIPCNAQLTINQTFSKQIQPITSEENSIQ